jgi:hypothetical protein
VGESVSVLFTIPTQSSLKVHNSNKKTGLRGVCK